MSPKSSSKNNDTLEALSYEAAFTELETIVSALEDESHSLEESIRLYERGQALAAHCAALLEKADLKVQQLSSGGESDFEGQG